MPKRTRVYSRTVRHAAALLGAQVRQARVERRWSTRELAERAGVSVGTLLRVERGDPTVSLGVAFDIATLVGVPLYFEDRSRLVPELSRARERLTLLPQRIREPGVVDDDFRTVARGIRVGLAAGRRGARRRGPARRGGWRDRLHLRPELSRARRGDLDARPDAWGQRVIMNRLLGTRAAETDPGDLGVIAYLLLSDSDRIGALDFQTSAERHVPRGGQTATLDELAHATELVQAGVPLTPALVSAIMSGTAIGGARPKALLRAGERRLIAKFSSITDVVPLVQGEYVAMELARRAGLDVAAVELTTALGKHVLLVERFDREPGSARRRAIVSALTILELREQAPWASYADLAQAIRARFSEPTETLRELFARITFNVIVGNTDDHARNHAAFWDGETLTLTPAYDVCPYPRAGGEASQAMIVGDDSDAFRLSQLSGCVRRAHLYGLAEEEARAIVDRQLDVVRTQWHEVCDLAQLSAVDRDLLWGGAVMHPFALEGYRGG